MTNVEGPPPRSFLDATGEDWRLAYERGVHSMLEVVRRCIPAMQERGFGRIVNISSISAKEITVKGLLANAFRPTLVGALGTLAREVAPDGVTVNNILPGPFDTDWLRHVARAHADAGGVYLWRERVHAEKWHGAQFRKMARETYGSEPDSQFFETPIVVDNLAGEIARD